jgi:hypothetical protein
MVSVRRKLLEGREAAAAVGKGGAA